MDGLLPGALGSLSLRSHRQQTSTSSSTTCQELPLPTSAVSLVSHTHGRERRQERGIVKRELQEAVKHGRRESANPGRDGGSVRWRYTHKGIVYITDATSRHEITSWKIKEAPPPQPPAAAVGGPAGGGSGTSHVIVIVDGSGSMRKDDVPGYGSRTEAVYDCLARDLVEPQLRVTGGSRMEVSLIEMQDDATVVFQRCAADSTTVEYLRRRSRSSRARSHGNYLPALDAALELMMEDAAAAAQNQLFLVFLSDGAPSDHTELACSHGHQVWKSHSWHTSTESHGGPITAGQIGKPKLQECPFSNTVHACRNAVRAQVEEDCLDRIRRMGDLLGRDRVSVNTVAFGPPSEDFKVLQKMSKVLPRGSFQKLGMSAGGLRTAFTSLTSDLATLRTAVGGGGGRLLTLRTDIAAQAARQEYEEHLLIRDGVNWDIYTGDKFKAKERYDPKYPTRLVDVAFKGSELVRSWQKEHPHLLRGVAHGIHKFAEGAERVVFQCTEVVSLDGGATAYAVGPRLVAKQSRYEEHTRVPNFHRTFCRTQGEAKQLAAQFNRRLAEGLSWQVHFVACFVYTIVDQLRSESSRGVMEILVEEELEGKYTKWNNNNGAVAARGGGHRGGVTGGGGALMMGAIVEDEGDGDGAGDNEAASHEDVPQAFSHFTWDHTSGQKLVCDLQGVWNSTDGFMLTDPVIHNSSGTKRSGATDKGPTGIRNFFSTHTCNALCKQLGLKPGPAAGAQDPHAKAAPRAGSSANRKRDASERHGQRRTDEKPPGERCRAHDRRAMILDSIEMYAGRLSGSVRGRESR